MSKAGRPKGTKKTGGRKQGTPNKVTGDLRMFVNDLINDNRNQIIKDLKGLKPYERLIFLEKMLGFVLPKKQATDFTLDVDGLTDEQANQIANLLMQKIK